MIQIPYTVYTLYKTWHDTPSEIMYRSMVHPTKKIPSNLGFAPWSTWHESRRYAATSTLNGQQQSPEMEDAMIMLEMTMLWWWRDDDENGRFGFQKRSMNGWNPNNDHGKWRFFVDLGRMFKRPFQRLCHLEIADGRGFLGSFSSIVFVGQFLL